MKKIYDPAAVSEARQRCGLSDLLFDPSVTLFLSRYEKGELLCSPLSGTDCFHVVCQGNVAVYSIREDGSAFSLAEGSGHYLIGDMELLNMPNENIYAEAQTPVTCLSINLARDRERLLENPAFLRMVAESLAQKLAVLGRMSPSALSLEERVCNYLRYYCPQQCFHGLEKVSFRLHCSARQLQRVMNRLEQSGTVKKTGKGSYVLTGY